MPSDKLEGQGPGPGLRAVLMVNSTAESWPVCLQFLKHMIHNGVLQDHSVLQKRLSNVLGPETTFDEAFRKTGARVCATGSSPIA